MAFEESYSRQSKKNPKAAALKLKNRMRTGKFPSSYTVRRGDSWFSVAGKIYSQLFEGDIKQGQRYAAELARANPEVANLKPGQVLRTARPRVGSPNISKGVMNYWAQAAASKKKPKSFAQTDATARAAANARTQEMSAFAQRKSAQISGQSTAQYTGAGQFAQKPGQQVAISPGPQFQPFSQVGPPKQQSRLGRNTRRGGVPSGTQPRPTQGQSTAQYTGANNAQTRGRPTAAYTGAGTAQQAGPYDNRLGRNTRRGGVPGGERGRRMVYPDPPQVNRFETFYGPGPRVIGLDGREVEGTSIVPFLLENGVPPLQMTQYEVDQLGLDQGLLVEVGYTKDAFGNWIAPVWNQAAPDQEAYNSNPYYTGGTRRGSRGRGRRGGGGGGGGGRGGGYAPYSGGYGSRYGNDVQYAGTTSWRIL